LNGWDQVRTEIKLHQILLILLIVHLNMQHVHRALIRKMISICPRSVAILRNYFLDYSAKTLDYQRN